eukprot:4908412-Amphidinium_carterae.1
MPTVAEIASQGADRIQKGTTSRKKHRRSKKVKLQIQLDSDDVAVKCPAASASPQKSATALLS